MQKADAPSEVKVEAQDGAHKNYCKGISFLGKGFTVDVNALPDLIGTRIEHNYSQGVGSCRNFPKP